MKSLLKKAIPMAFTAALMSTLCVGAVSAAELPKGASFELLDKEHTAVTDSAYTPEEDYTFWLYSPSDPHDFDMMSGQLNAVIYVYPDEPYANRQEALDSLDALGLLDIAESSPAYIVIPNPLNGASYTEEDLNLYYESQIYLAGGKIVSFTPPTGEYTRCTYNNLQYIIAEGAGATFVNNVLTQHASRIAGVLTFGGEMADNLDQGLALPAYLVNATDTATDYYKAVNEVDTEKESGHFINSSYVEKQVYIADGENSFDRSLIATAWADMLSRLTRAPMQADVVTNTADMSEWVLMTWPNYEELGLDLIKTSYRWGSEDGSAAERDYDLYEYVPESYDGETAVPLVVLLHGFTEDPLCPAATCGWADKAAEEGFILIAPDYINDLASTGIVSDCVMTAVNQTLEKYNIDESRIYLTGFSMGGMSTMITGYANADVFAAIAPMAGNSIVTNFQLDPEKYDLPTFFLAGTIDDKNVVLDGEYPTATAMNGNTYPILAAFNGIELGEPDYTKNIYGYAGDVQETRTLQGIKYDLNYFYNDVYTNPVFELVAAENVAHACSNVYADLAWEFLQNFSRAEDGAVIENFEDVDSDDYFAEPVRWARVNGIAAGTSEKTFSPENTCTRAEMVQFLYNAAGKPAVDGQVIPFADVNEDTWYYDAVVWAYNKGITAGVTATTFAPDAVCTRAEFVTFLYNQEGKPSADGLTTPFTDVATETWYTAPVAWAYSQGVTAGTSESTFSPEKDCLRCEVVTFLHNYMA